MSENLCSGPVSSFEEIEYCTDINQLKEIDNFLKCSICYEYFNTCVITDCSHNFCSLCIRRYIQFKNECPICFNELYDSQLRANRIVDTFIALFPELKDRIIRRIRTLKTLKPGCIYVSPCKNKEKPTTSTTKLPISEYDKHPVESSASLFMEAKKTQSPMSQSPNATPQHKIIIPVIFQSPIKKNSTTPQHFNVKSVQCPICSVDIPERNINLHLDVCLARENDPGEKVNTKIVQKRHHLPKLVLRLMSTSALRAKAKDYGLNSVGDIETLRNRIQKFTVLFNAECDKPNPRPVSQVIKQLEREEKILANHKLPKSVFSAPPENISKEEMNLLYLNENKNHFDELIKNVEKRESNVNKTDFNSTVKLKNRSALKVDHCEPSTSIFTPEWNNVNDIDIDEIKLEQIKEEVPLDISCDIKTKESCDQEINRNLVEDYGSSDDIMFVSTRKRSRRLNFDQNENQDKNNISFVNIPSAKDMCDELSGEDNSFKHRSFCEDENSNLSDSPVLRRKLRTKRSKEGVSPVAPKKSLRKKKRLHFR